MNMKTIIISLLAVAFLAGCAPRGKQGQRFTLIWRETSGIPIENVPTPDGFKVSPAEVVKPVMSILSLLPSAEYYLFVDATSYYCGVTHKGTEITAPLPGHYIINGTTGKMSDYIEEKDTEQKN
jgi:hypothetical protein